MNEIKIGTLLPGRSAIETVDSIINLGVETVSPSFHMTLGEIDLSEYAKKFMCTEKMPQSIMILYVIMEFTVLNYLSK